MSVKASADMSAKNVSFFWTAPLIVVQGFWSVQSLKCDKKNVTFMSMEEFCRNVVINEMFYVLLMKIFFWFVLGEVSH